MCDKGRCLESLSQKVQHLTLKEIRRLFLSKEIDAGADLLERWEQYLVYSKGGKGSNTQETLHSTIESFKKRLCALQNVVNSLPKQESVTELQTQLNALGERFASSSEASKGTFEWVDSILVKCLQEGTWLVIDNVNLCSSAILDRLNGLLEPGGELVLGERGVDSSGQLVRIKPHPNFRLFLVMDPRYGEISRAMRNRGVEICLLDSEDHKCSFVDLQAMLSQIGFSLYNHQRALINIHEEVKKNTDDFGEITTNNLIQVATLTVQQTTRGFSLSSSLFSACSDVYLQSRQLTLDQRQRYSLMLADIFKHQEHYITLTVPDVRDAVDTQTATLRTLPLQENSSLTLLEQKCVLLSAALKLVSEKPNCTLKSLLAEDLKGVNETPLFDKYIVDIIPYVLLTTISCISESDLCYRQNVVVEKIMSCKIVEERNKLLELSKYLSSTVQQAMKSGKLSSVDGVRRKDLYWDLRRISNWIVDCHSCDTENKTVALLYYFTHYLQLNIKLGEIKTNNVKSMSALDFSTAYNKGQVMIASFNEPDVQQLSVFLEALEDQIHSLMDSECSLDENQCCQLISAFYWSHRLLQISQGELFLKRTKGLLVNDKLVMLINLHVKWIKKWLLPLLERLNTREDISGVKNRLPSQLTNMCSDTSQTRCLRSLSKRVRSQLGQPLPLSAKLQGELAELVNRLEENINIAVKECSKSKIQSRVEFSLSLPGRQLRFKIAQALNLISTNHHLEEAIDELKEMQSTLQIDNMILSDGDSKVLQTNVKYHCLPSCWEVCLWPVKDLICLHLMSAVLTSHSDQLMQTLSSWVQELPCISPRVLAALNDRTCSQLKTNTILRAQLSCSLVVRNPWPLLEWPTTYQTEGDTGDQIHPDMEILDLVSVSNNESLSMLCPLLSLFTNSLLHPWFMANSNRSRSTLSLRCHRQQIKLLEDFKHLLWTTAPALASNILNLRNNEIKSFEQNYVELLGAMQQTINSILEVTELPPDEKPFSILRELITTKALPESCMSNSNEVNIFITDIAMHITAVEDTLLKLKNENSATDITRWMWVAFGWVHLGLMKIKLFAHQDHLDPVYKRILKLQYCQQEREDLERSLAVEFAQGVILGCNRFPLQEAFSRRIDSLKKKEESMKKLVAERPESNLYTKIYNEIHQFLEVIVEPSKQVEGVAKTLSACVEMAAGDPKEFFETINQAKSLHASILNTIENLNKKYGIWYPDVVVPVLSAISEINHGLHLMIASALHWHAIDEAPVEHLLRSLCCFPLPDHATMLELVNVCNSPQVIYHIKDLTSQDLNQDLFQDKTFRLAKCSLQELGNFVCVRGELWRNDWLTFCGILDDLMEKWEKQQTESAHKEQEESSFFINKPRNVDNLTEEEIDDIEMKMLFPTYRDNDFSDLDGVTLEQNIHYERNIDPNFKLSLNNILDISIIHSNIVTKHTKAHWIPPKKNQEPEFRSSFPDRLEIFLFLIGSLYVSCEKSLDVDLLPSFYFGVHLANGTGTGDINSKRKHYDFYRDPNISEVKQCIPILESLTKRVLELLDKWPDHPTLNEIIVVVNRILDFPYLSPVSRFLVGLELLLTKLKEWEENAHSGVTLSPQAAAVTRQVLDWRQLELAQWRGCLESAKIRLSEESTRHWWPFLYRLVSDKSCEDKLKLAVELEKFMETSNMADFHVRLDLLYTFHCHCLNSHKNEQSNIFWNIHQYYSQFLPVINSRLKELSAPVQKKLKDFVKIARWNDINYWAVKDTVTKTHRTLFKYIREYESILKQPACNAMTRLEPVNLKVTEPSFNPSHFIASLSLAQDLPEDNISDSNERILLNQQRSLFKRSRHLCRDYISNCALPENIAALHVTVDDLHETSTILSNEDVDRTVSKEKQKSAARGMLHRKHKTLTDLFHTLTDIGLSYRKGVCVSGKEAVTNAQFTLHEPLDVNAALSQMDKRLADSELKEAWDGCDRLFLQCVAFSAQLGHSLKTPHKDLGPAIIERCSGFASHIMSMCLEEKTKVSNSLTGLYQLRSLIQHLHTLKPSVNMVGNTKPLKIDLISLLDDIMYGLTQFNLLIDACPESPKIDEAFEFVNETPLIPESACVIIYKNDDNWRELKTKLLPIIQHCKEAKSTLRGTRKFPEFLELLEQSRICKKLVLPIYEDMQGLKDGCQHLKLLKSEISGIQHFFRMKFDGDSNPFSKILIHLENKIQDYLANVCHFENSCEQTPGNVQVVIETLLNKVLFAIQELYKNTSQHKSIISEAPIDNTGANLNLNNTVLTVLQNNLEALKLSDITFLLREILTTGRSQIELAKRCVPLLQQYSLLAQFLVTQQLAALRACTHLCSSLLSLFLDLVNKGFRVPEELMEDEGDGNETMLGGMGLGEGEGEKDVSDQIESQDQLEDAKKPGEHDKNEENDCKEEEKGIEMSDDFGGNLQDLEKKETDDESEEDDEDPDKEMGDTDKGAETLDQQIWGESDSEEEGTGDKDKEEEQVDRGEQTSEKELGAKDEDKTPQSEESEKHVDEQENKKKEINEMEEPDVDDDQIDPYHGKHQPQPEPEPLELPDDLQLDNENNDKENEGEEENPFDVDAMKESKVQEDGDDTENNPEDVNGEESNKTSDPMEDSSDEEDADGKIDDDVKDKMDIEEEDEDSEEKDAAGGEKDDNKTGEEPKPEEDNQEMESAKPSEDLPASEPVPSSKAEDGSKDQVNQSESNEQSKELVPEEAEGKGPEESGFGASQDKQESQRGGTGESHQAVQAQMPQSREEKRNRPGDSEEQRVLGDIHEPLKKKLKTIDMKEEDTPDKDNCDKDVEGAQNDQDAELYQHIKEAKASDNDAQTIDAATEEQASEQKLPNKEEEDGDELKNDNDMTMDQDQTEIATDTSYSLNPEELKEPKENKKESKNKQQSRGEKLEADGSLDVEGELISTMTVQRGADSAFYTKMHDGADGFLSPSDYSSIQKELELQLINWTQPPANEDAALAWERLCRLTADLSRDLSEQLRLVLEPTHASRLKGDFRTGRRINMRKVIPYIASQFRKDKIWLRRTKPAKREYQIVLAIDDSSSMADNKSKELAFESLAVVSKALSLLEAGELCVISFGEKTDILHQLGDPFTEHSGAKLLQQFSFKQQKTKVGTMVNFACSLLERNPPRRGVSDIAQLLLIVSDGRGVINDGAESVTRAVRRAKQMGVFLVFVIIDNPLSKDSILDIRLPKFSEGKLVGIVPYMDNFPFPFYLILKDINKLPSVLSDALRQWFELVTTIS